MGNRVIRTLFLARFDDPEADEVHFLGVEEVRGGANLFPDFVLLGKYYLLEYLIMSLIIIIIIVIIN